MTSTKHEHEGNGLAESLALGAFLRRAIAACVAPVLVLLCALVAPALADEPAVPGEPYPLSGIEEAAAASSDSLFDQLVDAQAAQELPHRNLDRDQAATLAESVFGGLLESTAGPFGDLNVEEFLTDHAALIAPDPPDAAITVGGEKAEKEEAAGAEGSLLLDSTLPLRTENEAGQERIVDLDLEHAEGELQPANPLIEVGVPEDLGEGVDLPSGNLELETGAGAEERSPSILTGNVAFYPNVSTDTDFAVATTPTGVETFALLRSPEAPQSQTLHLDLDEGATLEESAGGGAVAMSGEEEVLKVLPPTAIDAEGESVPVSLAISDDSLILSAVTDESTAFPVLLDPVIIESWPWYEKNNAIGIDTGSQTGDWRSWSNTSAFHSDNHVPWQTPPAPLKPNLPGLTVTTGNQGSVSVGSQANWNYYVPRYFTDYEKYGVRPKSFIQNMQMWNVQYGTYSNEGSPWLAIGIWDQALSKWVSVYSRGGSEGSLGEKYWTYLYNFPNPSYVQSAKNAGFGLLSSEAGANNGRILYDGYAALSLNDLDNPTIGEFYGPEGWVNDDPGKPITVTATDLGLGVKKVTAEPQNMTSPPHWESTWICTGIASEPCPRTYSFKGGSYGVVGTKGLGSDPNAGAYYNPKAMPQGIDYVKVIAEDALGNKSSSALVQVKVDHTAPSLTLSGTMTQQASLGYQRPQYVLHLDGSDGTTASPQSGIAASEITVDGKVVDSTNAGCATQNCTLSRDWTLNAASYSTGEHKVVATVKDGAGIVTTKSLTITIQKDMTAPELETWGKLRSAPEGWVNQVSRSIGANAKDNVGYGVTSLSFSIDGKVVKSVTQSCANGGCQGELSASVDMANYAGGAHSAEMVVKDGAGNTSKDNWTINVNPSGTVPSTEATDTIEATEETTESTALAPTSEVIDPAEVKDGTNPAVVVEGSSLVSTGTGADSSMTTHAGEGFTINNDQETFHIEPTKSTATETSLEATNGIAGVAANTTTGVDSVIRPIYDGVMEFESIRLSTAPESYSWKVQLHEGQELKVIDEEHAGIFYSDGTLALTITVEIAHDATGKEVPTSLGVSEGAILTLTVHHQGGGFTYPVTAGPTWQTGYETIFVVGPPTKQEEEAEEEHSGESEVFLEVGPPEAVGKGDDFDATASSIPTYRKYFKTRQCEIHTEPFISGCAVWEQAMEAHFYFTYRRYAWWRNSEQHPLCPHDVGPGIDIDTEFCDWVGPNHQKYGGGYHITAQVFFDESVISKPVTYSRAMTVRIFGSGGVHVHKEEDCICNPSVD